MFLLILLSFITVFAISGFGQTYTCRGDNPTNEGINKLFDNNLTSKWLDFSPTSWVQIQYSTGQVWNKYEITSGNDEPTRDPKNWTIQGSNNGTSWTTLSTKTNQTWSARNQTKTYTFTNTTAYKYYKWNITANSGASIIQSSELKFSGSSVPDTQAPSTPTGLASSNISQTAFTLSWTASTDNVGVVSYEVFRGATSCGTTTSTSMAISSLTCSTSYAMTVKSKDAAGNISAASASLNVSTSSCPPQITRLEAENATLSGPQVYADATASNGQCIGSFDETGDYLQWSNVPAVSTLKIVYASDRATSRSIYVNGTLITTVALPLVSGWGSTTINISIPANATLKIQRDAADNWWANIDYIELSNSGTVDTQAPSVPTTLASSAITVNSFTLTWTASTDNVGVTSYEVFKAGTSIGTTTSTSINVASLTCNTAYAMTVKAKDAAGNVSAASTALNVTTSSCPVVLPTILNNGFETPVITNYQYNATGASWNFIGSGSNSSGLSANNSDFTGSSLVAPQGTQIAFLQGTGSFTQDVTFSGGNYQITFKAAQRPIYQGSTQTFTVKVGTQTVGTFTPTTNNTYLSYTSNSFTANGVQTVSFVGTNPNGGDNTAFIDLVSIVAAGAADTQAPSVPSGLTSSAITQSSFTLSWTASTDNVGVTAYDVLKNGTSLGTTTSTSINVTGLVAGSTSAMTVKAKDAAGNISAASATLNVTTLNGMPASGSNYIGINLTGVTDFSEDRAFADVFRTARCWYKGTAWGDPNPRASLDARGWPTEDANLCVFSLGNMAGTYKLKFTGNANVSYNLGTPQNKVYNASTNTTTADIIITDAGNVTLFMSFTGTTGGVKDVKLMRPKTPGSTTAYDFNVEFSDNIINLINKFAAIRFLDWDATNGNISKNWSDAVPDDYFWGSLDATGYGWQGRGASWMSMIRLSNLTQKDAWINVPSMATDDYVLQLATLFKNNLNSNLKLYVEYSNEIWNFMGPFFTQAKFNADQAFAEVEAGPSPLNYDLRPVTGNPATEDFIFAQRRPGNRIVQISKIFRTVFGDAAMMTQVRPVLEWQMAAGANSIQSIELIDRVYGTVNQWNSVARPVNYYIYGAGGSAYYNPQNDDSNLTIDNIWTSASFNVNNFRGALKSDIDICAAYGVKRVAYEGGPSMDNSGHSEAVKNLAVDDPRMKTLMTEHHTTWNQYSGDLLMYFCATGDYQWGFTKSVFNLNSQKLQAIDQINATTKEAPNYGTIVPATINAGDESYQWGNIYDGGPTNMCLRANGLTGSLVTYTFIVTTAGTYNVSVLIQSGWSYSGTLQIYGDNKLLGIENLTTPGYTTPTYTMANLQPGVHSILLRNMGTTEISMQKLFIQSGAGVKSDIVTDNQAVVAKQSISIYPNPVRNDNFTIDLSECNMDENLNVCIIDLSGKIVYKNIVTNIEKLAISTTDFGKGMYIVHVKGNHVSTNAKLII